MAVAYQPVGYAVSAGVGVPYLVGKRFMQGDIVNTIITCADGSTISLRLDTTLPRHYSRELTVRGTKGLYEQSNNYVHLSGEDEGWEPYDHYKKYADNAVDYEEKYLPSVWKNITKEQLESGHGGMDAIEFRVFVDCLREHKPMPIDVYDAAAYENVKNIKSINRIKYLTVFSSHSLAAFSF